MTRRLAGFSWDLLNEAADAAERRDLIEAERKRIQHRNRLLPLRGGTQVAINEAGLTATEANTLRMAAYTRQLQRNSMLYKSYDVRQKPDVYDAKHRKAPYETAFNDAWNITTLVAQEQGFSATMIRQLHSHELGLVPSGFVAALSTDVRPDIYPGTVGYRSVPNLVNALELRLRKNPGTARAIVDVLDTSSVGKRATVYLRVRLHDGTTS